MNNTIDPKLTLYKVYGSQKTSKGTKQKIVLKFVLFIGNLILSVDKDTYEELGLQGRPSKYSGKKVMRYSKYYLY